MPVPLLVVVLVVLVIVVVPVMMIFSVLGHAVASSPVAGIVSRDAKILAFRAVAGEGADLIDTPRRRWETETRSAAS